MRRHLHRIHHTVTYITIIRNFASTINNVHHIEDLEGWHRLILLYMYLQVLRYPVSVKHVYDKENLREVPVFTQTTLLDLTPCLYISRFVNNDILKFAVRYSE